MTVLFWSDSKSNGSRYFSRNLTCDFGRLRTDPHHVQPGLLNFGVQVAKHAGLAGAARGKIRGVEIQDNRSGAQQLSERSISP